MCFSVNSFYFPREVNINILVNLDIQFLLCILPKDEHYFKLSVTAQNTFTCWCEWVKFSFCSTVDAFCGEAGFVTVNPSLWEQGTQVKVGEPHGLSCLSFLPIFHYCTGLLAGAPVQLVCLWRFPVVPPCLCSFVA